MGTPKGKAMWIWDGKSTVTLPFKKEESYQYYALTHQCYATSTKTSSMKMNYISNGWSAHTGNYIYFLTASLAESACLVVMSANGYTILSAVFTCLSLGSSCCWYPRKWKAHNSEGEKPPSYPRLWRKKMYVVTYHNNYVTICLFAWSRLHSAGATVPNTLQSQHTTCT